MKEDIEIIKDIEKACEFCERDFSYEELIAVLKGENDVEKQICILKLKELKSQEDADLLVFHLTDHHGIVRESTAIKICELICDERFSHLFQSEKILDSLLRAVNDINPNICRLIIDILPKIENKKHFLENLYKRFDFVFEEIEKLRRSNWYTKKLFNLYWCLESLASIKAPLNEDMERVLLRASKFREYTIREKVAMVVVSLDETSDVVDDIKSELSKDENFYVKRYMNKEKA